MIGVVPRAIRIAPAVAVVLAAAGPASALDVEPWDRVLRAHARGGGVDYAALERDAAAMADLDRFLREVATMPEDAPLAAWLNAYNALVVREVVRHHPIESVQSVPGFFDRRRHRVAGRMRTLDDVEHRVIRVRFPDARVHAALHCGARSCPDLYPRAFREETLDATLDRLARRMVADDRHVRVRDGRVEVSQLFEWFAPDFERDGGSVLGWLRRYDAGGKLRGVDDDADLRHLRYDWRLDDASGK